MQSPVAPDDARRTVVRATAVTLAVTGVVTALSYGLPARHGASGVGLAFLAATFWLALRGDDATVRRFGLALGGLFDPAPLDPRRLLGDLARAAALALAVSAVTFPPFVVGWVLWWRPAGHFALALPPSLGDELLGQLLVVALPEEAFYRGWLLGRLDEAWSPRVRLLGARLGPGVLLSSALFALGHLATDPHPARLAVFFPALLFAWMRARSGGIGAAVLFHAACNVLSATLARSYGLAR